MAAGSTAAAVGRQAALRGRRAKAREVEEEAEGGSAKQARAVDVEGREGRGMGERVLMIGGVEECVLG